jgi:hypothetical protein
MNTGAASTTRPAPCPLPPTDLASRQIPTCTINTKTTTLLRIHQTVRESVFFTRRGLNDAVYRFDAPDDEYGVLYVSEFFDVCMAETVIRNRFNLANPVLSKSFIESRSIATLNVPDQDKLTLVDLRAPLWPIGGSLEISSTSDYAGPNAWSEAFHDLPADYDGICFPSRYSNEASIVLFDRVNVMQQSTQTLVSDVRLVPFLTKYGVRLE